MEAINSQRFKRFWAPLTERYLAHKEAMGWSSKIWEASELLKDSIDWWRVKTPVDGYAIGIKKGIYYTTETGKKLEVRKVAMWMEYGTGEQAEKGDGKPGFPGMPSRPLFRPLRIQIRKNIGRYYNLFINEFRDEIDEMLAEYLLTGEV